MSQQMTPRQRYFASRQRKQSMTFSVAVSIMAVLVIISLLTILNIVNPPFGNSFAKSEKFAEAGDIPCPSADAQRTDHSQVTVRVLNGTQTQGLAGQVTEMLKNADFNMLDPQNAPTDEPASVEIDAGPRAVNDAYTVARFFPESRVTLTDSTDTTVTVLVGTFYDGVLSEEDFNAADSDTSTLTGQANCLPIDPNSAMMQDEPTQSGDTEQSGQSGQSGDSGQSGQSGGSE